MLDKLIYPNHTEQSLLPGGPRGKSQRWPHREEANGEGSYPHGDEKAHVLDDRTEPVSVTD
jgi:hypothetical protein